MKKNDIIKLDIIDITRDGLGLAKVSGQVFFVKDGILGDKVEAIITKIDKNIVYAKATKILYKSKFRVDSICDISNACGGCQLLNLNYEKQIEIKKNYVLNCLKKIGSFKSIRVKDNDDCNENNNPFDESLIYDGVVKTNNFYYYRNKMQIPFSKKNGKIIFGFYAGRTHSIVEFNKCKVGFEGSNEILTAIKLALEEYNISIYDEKTNTGIFREVMLRRGNNSKEVSITYIVNDKDYNKNLNLYEKFDSYVVEEYKKQYIKSCNCSNDTNYICKLVTSTLNINTNANNVIFGNKNIILRGTGYIEDKIRDIKYHISPESFYQVNSFMTENLYDLIIEFANFNGNENVMDLYCGIGTISLYISKYVKSVLGIEIVEKAIENAKENTVLNNIKNVRFLCKDLSSIGLNEQIILKNDNKSLKNVDFINIIDENIVLKNESYDTIIVDPPRKGLDSDTIAFIKSIKPKKIIYVSCDPATLSRDLKLLCIDDRLYKIKRIKSVDMFPHTMHIETVCLLEDCI